MTINPKARAGVYLGLALAGLVLGTLSEAFAAYDLAPVWLDAVTRAYAFLAAPATGLLAVLNIQTATDPRAENAQEGWELP